MRKKRGIGVSGWGGAADGMMGEQPRENEEMKSFTMDQRTTLSRISKEASVMTAKESEVSLELRQRDQPQTIYAMQGSGYADWTR